MILFVKACIYTFAEKMTPPQPYRKEYNTPPHTLITG
jgi:hypothetical protein